MSQFNFPGVNNTPSPFGTIGLPNLTTVQLYASNLSTGDHNLYTVPAGKKAIVVMTLHNASGVGNILSTPTVSLDAGVTYLSTNAQSTTANGATSGGMFSGWIYSAAQVVGLNTATNNAANVFGTIYLFDSSSPLKTVFITSFTTGDNTLYTVPAGKQAFTVYGYGALISGNANNARLNVLTTSSQTIATHVVLSGGSVATTNRVSTGAVNGIASINLMVTMNTGDFININTASGAATTLGWTLVSEQ